MIKMKGKKNEVSVRCLYISVCNVWGKIVKIIVNISSLLLS